MQLVAISATIDYWMRVKLGLGAALGPPRDAGAEVAAKGKKTAAAERDLNVGMEYLRGAGICEAVPGRTFKTFRAGSLIPPSARLPPRTVEVLLDVFKPMTTTEQTLLQVASEYATRHLPDFCDVCPGDAAAQPRSTPADEADVAGGGDDDGELDCCAICESEMPEGAVIADWTCASCACVLCPAHRNWQDGSVVGCRACALSVAELADAAEFGTAADDSDAEISADEA